MFMFGKRNKLVDARSARKASEKGLNDCLTPLRTEVAARIDLATRCGEYNTFYSNTVADLKYIKILAEELKQMGYRCHLNDANILLIEWYVQAESQEPEGDSNAAV